MNWGTVIGILLFVVGLMFSIWWHELGHFTAARVFKMRVSQFMIGFGKTIYSKKIGETEHGIKAVPLGGYIRIIGMVPPAKPGKRPKPSRLGLLVEDIRAQSMTELRPGDEARAFYTKPWWQRAIVMLAGPVQNLILAFVLFAVLFCAIGVPTASLTIAEVEKCVLPATTNVENCTTPVDADGKKCAIGTGECALPIETPAKKAGFLPGDTIRTVNGRPAGSWDDVRAAIKVSADTSMAFVVDRQDNEVTLSVTPLKNKRYTDATGEKTEIVGYLGIGPTTPTTTASITEVPGQVGSFIALSAEKLIELPQRVPQLFAATFGGEKRDPNGPIGIVGVGRLSGEFFALPEPASAKIAFFIQLLASLNMVLFLFNLVPLYPLDGGHVAGALWEGARNGVYKLRGKRPPGPFDIARLMPTAYVVAGVFVLLSGVLLIADIINPITLGSQ